MLTYTTSFSSFLSSLLFSSQELNLLLNSTPLNVLVIELDILAKKERKKNWRKKRKKWSTLPSLHSHLQKYKLRNFWLIDNFCFPSSFIPSLLPYLLSFFSYPHSFCNKTWIFSIYQTNKNPFKWTTFLTVLTHFRIPFQIRLLKHSDELSHDIKQITWQETCGEIGLNLWKISQTW